MNPPIFNSQFFFGKDHFEFFFEENSIDLIDDITLQPICRELDMDNSSFAYISLFGREFMYQKISPAGYNFGFKFQTNIDYEIKGKNVSKTVDCFSIIFGGKNGNVTTKNKCVLHSGFFVLEQTQKLEFTIHNFVQTYFRKLARDTRRIDIAFDLPCSINELLTYFNSIDDFHSLVGKKKNSDTYETLYTNDLSSDRNRNFQIRIYDKVLDSFKKGKTFLFPHLQKHENVTRIEIEMRIDTCARIPFNVLELLDEKNQKAQDRIKSIFIKKLNKYLKPQSKLDFGSTEMTPYKKYDNDLHYNYLTLGHIPSTYISRFNGYLSSILENTGYEGLFQSIVGIYMDLELPKIIAGRTPEGLPIYREYQRNPLEILEHFIDYLHKQGLPTQKINKILKNGIRTPKIKL